MTNNTNQKSPGEKVKIADAFAEIKSATPLSALQLNGFKLDIKHTVLTPEYLERQQAENSTDKAI